MARLEVPVTRSTLRVYGRLLAALGQAFLHARYHTLLDRQRFEALEQRFEARTTALHHEMAERQRLEHAAQQAAHFAMLGRLAAGVCHEIRNPLGCGRPPRRPLGGGTRAALARQRRRRGGDAGGDQDAARASGGPRTGSYLSLVRVGDDPAGHRQISAGAVQAWATAFHALAGVQGVRLQVEALATLGSVALSCRDVAPRASLTWCRMRSRPWSRGGTLTLTGQRTPTHVQLHIRDTGSGIASAHRAHISNPCTRADPGGTGLGLYMVQEIVAAHGGQVTVESTEGQGTTVTVTLPQAGGTAGEVLAP